jgi:pimeloyl-ACP methyl ester carboxylesterase
VNPPAPPHWHGYYDPDEVAEIESALRTTSIQSGTDRLCVRIYDQPGDVPTVLIAHGLLGYGLSFARFHLPFWRHGWRVVQFDLPGMGESTGTRGAATVPRMIAAWRDVAAWAVDRYPGPFAAAGNAEDGVVAYYALANDPAINALSVHTLFEYGDPHAVGWVHPALVRTLRPAFAAIERIYPRASLPGQWTIPWPGVFAGRDDARYRRHLAADRYSLRRGRVSLGLTLMTPRKPAVAFEDCTTPVQVVISRQSRIWPAGGVRSSAERLGGPREIIEIDAPHWEASRQFHDEYCRMVTSWFERWRTPSEPTMPVNGRCHNRLDPDAAAT